MSNKKSQRTQKLVNSYPHWSDVRSDEQSFGQQLLNSIGNELEKLDIELLRISSNYHLTTANLDEIDLVYQYQLEPDFEFSKNTSDTGHTTFVEPTMSGQVDSTWYDITVAPENDIQSFWYTSKPNRYTTSTTASGTHTVLSSVDLQTGPFTTSLNEPHRPGHLYITVSGGDSFLDDIQGETQRGTVLLEGTTRRGTEESEFLIFLFNQTQKTEKEWESLDRVSVFNISPKVDETAYIEITSADYNLGPYLDAYNLEHGEFSREQIDTFWDVGTTTSGSSTLDLVEYNSDLFENLLLGFDGKQTVRQFELLTPSGQNIDTAVDMAVQPFTLNLWVCTASGLYLYNNEKYSPDMNELDGKDYDSAARIIPDSYHKVLYDDLTIEYFYKRPLQPVVKHRALLKTPSGTEYGIVGGSLVTTGDYWHKEYLFERELRSPDTFTLDERGDYLLTLEVVYKDGTKDVDKRIVSVETKTADLELSLNFTASGVTFDSDQRMWIVDDSNVHRRIDLRKDIALVDYENKVVYLHEEYDDIQVSS